MIRTDGWKANVLSDLVTINYGQSPTNILANDGPYPVVGTGSHQRKGESYIHDGESIILGRKGTIDQVYFIEGKFWAIDTAYYLTRFDQTIPRWLYYYFQSIDLRLLNEATGVPSLSRNLLYKIQLSTPPITEQRKIAHILSTVDRAIEQTEALIAKQQSIKSGLMQDLLTRGIDEQGNLRSEKTHQFKDSPLGRIPVEWEVDSLDNLLAAKQYGISTGLVDAPIGIPVLRMNNLANGEVHLSNLKYSICEKAKKLLLNDRDVLFNRTNSIEYVGRTGIYRQTSQSVSFASYLVRLVPNGLRLHPEYLNIWLNSPTNQIRVKQLATVGVQQANVNPTNLSSLLVAIPGTLKEQEAIIECISASKTHIHCVETSCSKLRALKTALMQDLLTGRKRVTALLQEKEMVNT